MSLSEVEIERVVREVLRRLPGEAGADADGSKPTETIQAETKHSGLELDQRLITQADLAGRLDGVQMVTAPERAVVTPAALDHLRERGVRLVRRETKKNGAKQSQNVSLIVGVADAAFRPAELVRLLREQGIEVEQVAASGLTGVVDELADQVGKGGRTGLLLTDQAAAGACLANRSSGVRAACVASLAGVEAAIRTLGVNLLIVEPAGRGLHELKQIVGRYASGAPHACPVALASKLE